MPEKKYLLAIDLGAGQGSKIGLFSPDNCLLAQTMLPLEKYGNTAESLADALTEALAEFLRENDSRLDAVRAVGVATPGLLRSDDSFLLAANLPFLNDHNLKNLLAERTGLPVALENDANAGAIAEWSILRVELLYWVFGGGWGGAWVTQDGKIKYPCRDWDWDDATLHYTSEPGYAIPLPKKKLRDLFYEVGASFDQFEEILAKELGVSLPVTGPSGSPDHLRAEAILSGPGRFRLFHAIVGDDDAYCEFLNIHETSEIRDSSIAGKHISKLSRMRVEAAINTDRLFGKILAEALHIMVKQAKSDDIKEDLPICLGGKPSYALPYFGPSTQRKIGSLGMLYYLRPSVIDDRGSNANLVGAATMAEMLFNSQA
jgi:hypothetical protein